MWVRLTHIAWDLKGLKKCVETILYKTPTYHQFFMCLVTSRHLKRRDSFHFYYRHFLTEAHQSHFFTLQSWTKFKIGFFISCFTSKFLVQISKFVHWVAGWVLTIKSKYFREFLEIWSWVLGYSVILQAARSFTFWWW